MQDFLLVMEYFYTSIFPSTTAEQWIIFRRNDWKKKEIKLFDLCR